MNFSLTKVLFEKINYLLNKTEKYFKYLFIFFVFQWILLAWANYYSFNFHTWDTASFANPISNLIQTGNLYNTFLERHAFADHFDPNLLFFYPFFLIKNTTLWLTIAKIIAFSVCPFLLIKTGKLINLPSHLIYVAPLIFLLNKYLANTLAFEFQPSSLSLPFIILIFNYAIEKKYLKMALFLILILGFKEHMALIWISVGAYIILFQKEPKIGITLIIIGLGIGIIIFFTVMPSFAIGLNSLHSNRFNPFSLYSEKFLLIYSSLLAVGLIPLMAPRTLLFIIPSFGISLVSQDPNMMTFNYHYQDIALAVLFVGVVVGLSKTNVLSLFFTDKTNKILPLLSATLIITNSNIPYKNAWEHWPTKLNFEIMGDIEKIREVVKKDTTLWVTEKFSIYFIDYPKLKSIDIWGGDKNLQRTIGEKAIIIPRDSSLSSLNQETYNNLISYLEFNNKDTYLKNNNLKNFVVYYQ